MGKSYAGRLLVATPKLADPNFYRTVVLVCSHDDDGAFGVVLNRPLPEIDVVDHLPAWSEFVPTPAVMFQGGPVETSGAVAVGRMRGDHADGWRPVHDPLGLVDLGRSPEELHGVDLVRVFVGYAGWGGAQLEAEVADGAWFVVEAEPEDAFTSEPDDLWRRVLRRQRGQLAMYAFYPDDPRTN